MRAENLSDVLKDFFAPFDVKTPDEVGADTDLGRRSHTAEQTFTFAVRALTLHGNPLLSTLGRHLWNVLHFQIVHLALAEILPGTTLRVDTPYFWSAVHNVSGTRQGVIFLPMGWMAMVQEDPVMQFGAVIFTGSQAVDYHNGRIGLDSTARIRQRACAYEAEMLRGLNRLLLNEYQLHMLAQFPNGFEAHLGYPFRDVVASRA